MRGPFPFQWIFSRLLMSLSILSILSMFLSLPVRLEIVRADAGKAVMSIQPTFFPHPNARPRAYFIYYSVPTALIQDSVTVKNVGRARGTIDLFPVDAITSQSSGTAFTDPHQSQHDVGAWIRLSKRQVTLNPGQSMDIPFRLNIPDHVRPGQHGGGILAEVSMQLPARSSSSNPLPASLHFQSENILGVLINLPGAITEKLSATGITYDTENTYQRILIALNNTGTQLIHPHGNLQILNTAGQLLKNESLQLDTFLPQTSINYPVYIHHNVLNPGTYTARLHLNYEHNHSLNYLATFVIPQPQLQKNNNLPRVIADLVTLQPNLFSTLTPVHYMVGIVILLSFLWSLFSWGKKLHVFLARWKQKSK